MLATVLKHKGKMVTGLWLTLSGGEQLCLKRILNHFYHICPYVLEGYSTDIKFLHQST